MGTEPACYNGVPTASIIQHEKNRLRPKGTGKAPPIKVGFFEILQGMARGIKDLGKVAVVVSLFIVFLVMVYEFNMYVVRKERKMNEAEAEKVEAERRKKDRLMRRLKGEKNEAETVVKNYN